jgi:hypothetical protein
MGKKKKSKKPATKTIYRTTPAAKTPAKRRVGGVLNSRKATNSTTTLIAVGSAALVGFIKGKKIGFPQIPAIGINGTIALVAGVTSLFLKPGKGKEITSMLALIHGSIYAADLGGKLATGENLLSGEESVSGMAGPNMLNAAPAGMTLVPNETLQQLQAALEGDDEDLEGDDEDLEGDDEDLEGDDEDLEGDEVSGFSVN